ncbi:ALK and LTK ligand 1 [Alligator sinensis]|uniref:ALK and LTK ligand 1 n=1 Tax=Alligator sinensis TaxID=38654 RepID=A0A3Q0GKP9_ALLSI|nr:ALK and LTK ligand 1 [Alligator sinensis]
MDTAALRETRLTGEGQLKKVSGGYTFWNGKPDYDPCIHGVGFAIRNKIIDMFPELPSVYPSVKASVEGQTSLQVTRSRNEEIFPRDSNLKDKFIKHFTGPVTFSAECSKHFHRLYHNTRDCSTPAYYKRCARLLTRLAMSPLCTQS